MIKQCMIIIMSIWFCTTVYSQTIINKHLFEMIEPGYTTRWDIEQIFGKGKYLEKKIINPDNEQDSGKTNRVFSNGLSFIDLGLTFECAEDGELISGIQFRKPYKGIFEMNDTIEVGKTKIVDIFPQIETFKVTTSKASNYWSFEIGKNVFYVKKTLEHQAYYYFNSFSKNSFKDNLTYYKNQPISIVSMNIYDYKYFKNEPIVTNKNQLCIKPIYAPKNEPHLNCYEKGWPKELSWIEIPFYALTGGGKSEIIKQGYWKEYSPGHILAYEGEYKDNKKVGLFKYYDKNGKLERTENLRPSTSFWTWIIIVLLGFLTTIVVWNRNKHKSTN